MPYPAVALATAIPVLLGILVARRGPALVGWLLVAHGLSVGVLLLGSGSTSSTGTGALVVDQLLAGGWVFLFLWLVLVAYLVPDGRPLSNRWRNWLLVGVLGAVLFLVGSAGDGEGFREQHGGLAPPLPWLSPEASGALGVSGLVLVVLLFLGSALAVRARWRASSGVVRAQLMWLLAGALAVPLGLVVVWANYFLLGQTRWVTDLTLSAISVALPVTIAIAILRHRLFDIQVVLSRTLTYGALLAAVVLLYAVLLLGAERMGGSGTAGGLVAVAVVAVAVHPAYSWLRQRVERWVYGYRSQPHQALRMLADRAEAADVDALDAVVTDAIADALRVDRVWVEANAAVGEDQAVRVPLNHRGENLATLAVHVPPGRRLSPEDLTLLHDLAKYAAVLLRHQRQEQQLRQSRTSIVAAREEERRRLRQDLHDGVGPCLAAVVLTLNAAESSPDSAERSALITEARDQVRSAIAEVRRAVDDLRPPAVDEVGLLAAIRQRAATMSVAFPIEVSGPDPLPALPAAVEVAAFRIASEALANVAQHARATLCRVEVHLSDQFELTIADNGRGADGSTKGRGFGWESMHERAAELGGSCRIANLPEGGLIVRAVFPIEETQGRPGELQVSP
jgi:two-component system NarL family sensor kinase